MRSTRWANLENWVVKGTAPPSEASREDFDSGILGEPTGGLRSPAVDVPVADYYGGSVITNSNAALENLCALLGYQTPNTASYGSSSYASLIKSDVASLLAAKFLTQADANALTANPTLAATFPDGTTTIP